MPHYIEMICKYCNCQYNALYKQRNKRQFCSRKCADKSHRGKGNPAFGKTYQTKETNPNWAAAISKSLIERGVNVGERNGMKNPEARKKASDSRKKLMEDPAVRKHLSETSCQAWIDGKFEGVRVGQCKW